MKIKIRKGFFVAFMLSVGIATLILDNNGQYIGLNPIQEINLFILSISASFFFLAEAIKISKK